MTRRSKVWWGVAMFFAVGNAAGAVFAAISGEPIHATIHLALALIGAVPAWRLAPGRDARRDRAGATAGTTASSGEFDDHLTHLEQSVDAVAIEVERLGEGQRFMTSFLADNGLPRPAGSATAEPAGITPPATPPNARRD